MILAENTEYDCGISGAGWHQKFEYNKQIEELRSMQEDAQKKLEELQKSGDDAWEDLKAGIDSAWDSLNSSIKSAVSRFS